MIITVPLFAIAFLLLAMHQSSPTEYQSDLSPSPSQLPSPTGYLRRTGTQSDWMTSDDCNWCIPTCRVFETRIFVSSNFKKMRKYRFYWWSSFVDLFLIEVLNDFGQIKRIDVFWSKGDPVGTGYQLDRLPSRTGYPVTQSETGLGVSDIIEFIISSLIAGISALLSHMQPCNSTRNHSIQIELVELYRLM